LGFVRIGSDRSPDQGGLTLAVKAWFRDAKNGNEEAFHAYVNRSDNFRIIAGTK
jgi:hypothetical protein